MSYQVIARKWRPQRFSDMVGQEHIARTLKNTIITGRIAHAYLFVGPRGIGKTTSARIFAKALNCMHPVDGEPCCQCSSCKSIANESNVDVIEIDAATHTQVEKARELCEDVLHLPICSKYRIYIIDEVHMLSKSAWNALLKTIEEPPQHAKFIFATTEVNKVLPTVISRCQRFDLRRIHSSDIAARLRLICDAEHVNISDSAIHVIAQAADGGMRDAQSLLDQLISFFGTDQDTQISEQQALSLFGLTATGEMETLVRAVLKNDRTCVIKAIHTLGEQGKNLETLYEELLAWLRGILLCHVLDNPDEVLEESPERIGIFLKLKDAADANCIQRLLENLSASGYLLRDAINKQVFLESVLLKAMRLAHAVQVEDLIARLNQIRNAGELDAINSVVPLYEMPRGQILTAAGSKYAPVTPEGQTVELVTGEKSPETTASGIAALSAAETKDESGKTEKQSVDIAVEKKTAEHEVLKEEQGPVEHEVRVNDPVSVSAANVDAQTGQAEQAGIPETDAAEKKEQMPEKTVIQSPVAEQPPVIPVPAETLQSPVPETEKAPETLNEGEDHDSGDETEDDPDAQFQEELAVSDEESSYSRQKAPGRLCQKYQSANELWMSLITDIREFLKKPLLASFMMEATPEKIEGSVLSVAFDEDYESLHYMMMVQDISLLNRRLKDISGDGNAALLCNTRKGLASPVQIENKKTMEEMKQKALQNPLVSELVNHFEGRLVDVHDLTKYNGNSPEF